MFNVMDKKIITNFMLKIFSLIFFCFQDSTSSGELCQPMSVMRITPQSSTESCGEQGTPSQPQAQPQTMVVGQSIPQQYPQSPAQTVPPTQVRNYVVILGALPLSPSLRPWLLGRVYHSSILSLQHRQCLPLR